MTPPLPPMAQRSERIEASSAGSRLVRALEAAKRAEPARLYLYGLVAAVVLVLAVVGVVTEDLAAALTGLAAALLVGVPGAAMVRASVYSPAGRSQERLADSMRWAAQVRAGQLDPSWVDAPAQGLPS